MPDPFRGKYRGEESGKEYANEVQMAIDKIQESWKRVSVFIAESLMGNGHPLSAVVTTKAIAEEFNNGMEYFNSFGGNPVSCAVGHAVLNVIEEEGLQQNAKDVGFYLKSLLNELKEKYSIIGDVRGFGLFLGIELVRDPESLEPADKEAEQIVNSMKEKDILISTDGPDHNVLKIKPPLVFTKDNAIQLVETLNGVLNEADY